MQIGNWLDMRIEKDYVIGTAWFNETDKGEEWWKLYSHPDKKKRARGFSVGILVHGWEMREFDMGGGVKKQIRVFTEVELIEVSATPIPANRGAGPRRLGLGRHATEFPWR